MWRFRLQPMCCRSDDVQIIEQTCKSVTLNAVASSFDHSLQRNQIYQGMKCWRQFDLGDVLQDFIWQPTVCGYVLSRGNPIRGNYLIAISSSWVIGDLSRRLNITMKYEMSGNIIILTIRKLMILTHLDRLETYSKRRLWRSALLNLTFNFIGHRDSSV